MSSPTSILIAFMIFIIIFEVEIELEGMVLVIVQ